MDLSNLASGRYDTKTAQNELNTFYKTAKKPIDYYNEATTRLGVGDARAKMQGDRKAIDDTSALIEAVDPSVTGRTSGALVTDAQRQGLITKEKTPLLGSLGKLQGIYGTSSANYNDLLSQAERESSWGYMNQQNQLAALQQRLQQAQYWEQQEAQRRAAARAAADNAAWLALQKALADQGNVAGGNTTPDRYPEWLKAQKFGEVKAGDLSGLRQSKPKASLGTFSVGNTSALKSRLNVSKNPMTTRNPLNVANPLYNSNPLRMRL